MHIKQKATLANRTTRGLSATVGGMRPQEDDSFRELRKQIIPKWAAMRRACLKQDPVNPGRTRAGVIPGGAFKAILRSFKIKFTDETFYHVHSFTDKDLKHGVKYDAFFQEMLGTK